MREVSGVREVGTGNGKRQYPQKELAFPFSLKTMKCPFCGATDTQVIDSRVSEEGDSIRRRRRCVDCSKRFTTYETAELRMPQVVKQNGIREEFKREKLRISFVRALHKRPVPTEYVDAAIQHIEQELLGLGEREIPARRVGEMVMAALYKLDKVAYIRFASVYRSFQDVEDFREVIQDIDSGAKRAKAAAKTISQSVPKPPKPTK